jgi:hypothetical protein
LIVVNAENKIANFPALLNQAKANPGKIAYGTAGIGSTHHLAGELLASMAKVDLLHVPYRGDAGSITALLSGDVPFIIAPPTAVLSNIKAGKLKAIAATGPQRWVGLPDVPTVAEQGVPGYDVRSWAGLMAPAGVYFAGLSFGLRDLIQEAGGRAWVWSIIILGAAISYFVSDGSSIPGGYTSIAAASGVAFLLSETMDFLVYTPLRVRHLNVAIICSNVVGAVADSIVFLLLAFGSIDLIYGQILGKIWMTIPAIIALNLFRRK